MYLSLVSYRFEPMQIFTDLGLGDSIPSWKRRSFCLHFNYGVFVY